MLRPYQEMPPLRSVSSSEMQRVDYLAQTRYGIPDVLLMEHAGMAAAAFISAYARRRKLRQVLVVCGPGNNGGDGFVVARGLREGAGLDVRVAFCGQQRQLAAAALVNYRIARRLGIAGIRCSTAVEIAAASLVVDALFGIGLRRPLTGRYARLVRLINAQRCPVISLDVPSGLCATHGRIMGVAVRAAVTLTFGLPKQGLVTTIGKRCSGRVYCLDIGLPRVLIEHYRVDGRAQDDES